MTHANFSSVRTNPNDEFYTLYDSIEKELSKYPTDIFKGKIVYCNCDYYRKSQFPKWFKDNFARLGLKEVRATNIQREREPASYWRYDGMTETVTQLNNGSWDSEECLSILEESDIVITNPPFSQIKYLVPYLADSGKKWTVICHCSTFATKGVLESLQGKYWCAGYTALTKFYRDGKIIDGAGDIVWYGNILKNPPVRDYVYEPCEAQFLDNMPEVLFCPKCVNLPKDWNGYAAVPVAWINKNLFGYEVGYPIVPIVNGKSKFKRLLVRKKC